MKLSSIKTQCGICYKCTKENKVSQAKWTQSSDSYIFTKLLIVNLKNLLLLMCDRKCTLSSSLEQFKSCCALSRVNKRNVFPLKWPLFFLHSHSTFCRIQTINLDSRKLNFSNLLFDLQSLVTQQTESWSSAELNSEPISETHTQQQCTHMETHTYHLCWVNS